MKKLRLTGIAITITLLLLSPARHLYAQAARSHNAHAAKTVSTLYKVIRVVDGDTFWIEDGSNEGKKIRMIGIDAPESRNAFKKVKAHYGDKAKAYLENLLTGKKVRLEYDITRKDQYGRTLAYVYLENGRFVNALMVQKGYALALTVPPNVKHAERFNRLQQQARDKRRGLWANYTH